MSDAPAPPAPPAAPTGIDRWRQPLIAATMVATLFATIFLAALGEPAPNGVAVAVVGPVEVADRVQAGLDDAVDGGFDVTAAEDADAADELLRSRDAYGVLDVEASPPQVRIAAFNGAALNGAVQGALVPAASGFALPGEETPTVVDIQAGEGKPISTFYIVFGMVIAAMAFTVASGTLTPFATAGGIGQRLLASILTALVVGIAVAAVAWAFDALPGSYVQVAAIAALLMLALALCVQGLVLLLGPAGLVLSAIFFIMVGNAASGAAVHALLLGSGWRQASPLLPTGAGTTAIVDVAAFTDAALVTPLVVLAAWALLGAALVGLGYRRRAARAAAAA